MYNYFKLNILMIISMCYTQVSVPSIPKSFNSDETLQFSTIILPSFDVDQFLIEDENEIRSDETKPYRFANPIPVSFDMENSGMWTELDNGSLIWLLEIESTNAFSLNLIYDTFNIPEGAEFFVYSESFEGIATVHFFPLQ